MRVGRIKCPECGAEIIQLERYVTSKEIKCCNCSIRFMPIENVSGWYSVGPKIIFMGTIENSRLKTFFEAASTLNDDVHFKITENGLSFETIDPEHIAMSNGILKLDAFSGGLGYDHDAEMYISVDTALTALKMIPSSTMIKIYITKGTEIWDNGIILQWEEDGHLIKRFIRSPIDISESRKIPKFSFNTECNVSPRHFYRLLKLCYLKISDAIVFYINNDHIRLESNDDDRSFKASLTDDILRYEEKEKNFVVCYPLNYCYEVGKVTKRADSLHLHFKNHYPFEIEASWEYGLDLQVFIAPILTTDECKEHAGKFL